MAYSKPYLPVPDQLTLIKSRGMTITDDALAQSYLEKIVLPTQRLLVSLPPVANLKQFSERRKIF
jgi:hypothetical protein